MNSIDDFSTTNQRTKVDREYTTMVVETRLITTTEKEGDHPTMVVVAEDSPEVEEG